MIPEGKVLTVTVATTTVRHRAYISDSQGHLVLEMSWTDCGNTETAFNLVCCGASHGCGQRLQGESALSGSGSGPWITVAIQGQDMGGPARLIAWSAGDW